MNVKSRIVQRKWRYSRKKTPVWLESLLALAAALLIHILFFGGLKYKEMQPSQVTKNSKITLYNLENLSASRRKQAEKWLSLHDPKLVVRGDSPVGFASFISEEKSRRISVNEFKVQLDLPKAKEIKYTPVKHVPAQIETLPDVPLNVKTEQSNAIVLDENGGKLAIDLSQINAPVAGTSLFAVSGSGLMKRIKIIKGCSKKQDELAANVLVNAGLKDNQTITVVWLGEKR